MSKHGGEANTLRIDGKRKMPLRSRLMTNAITSEDDFLKYLIEASGRADRIRLIVSFLMESGAKLIAPALQVAVARGVDIQILTGRYLSITEPSAIYYLLDKLGAHLDIRFFSNQVRSFHPKAYLFEYGEEAEAFVGSSNLSRTALTTGVEWNYRFYRSEHPEDYEKFKVTFDDLFANTSDPITEDVLRDYSAHWKKPNLLRVEQAIENQDYSTTSVEPLGAQIEALYELRRAREEGVTKGLVVAATGVGKTFIAAFDSLTFRRILFVAHREEILVQAEKAFKAARPTAKTGFYIGRDKDRGMNICFASVQTLASAKNREVFPPDYFDYMVVDEFHHAAADSYLRVLEYFKPKFLLGLTATPYRSDNRDIYAICEDNVIYEIYLRDAINRDLLVPFQYYGVFDDTDYSQVDYRNGSYVIEDLERELSREGRAELVLETYRKLALKRSIGFCVSIRHAEYMAEFFSRNGVPSAAVHSANYKQSSYTMERSTAIKALKEGALDIIFSVDIFNEGVDIPSLDTVLFLRPTESFVIFLQQLGRGLRKYPEKSYLRVLDFIGNYKRAHYIPALLAGENPMTANLEGRRPQDYEFPEGCIVQFDMKVLDVFDEMAKADPLAKRIRDDYFRLKRSLGRRPNRLDVYEGSDIPIREFLKKGWLRFLEELDELLPEEKSWLDMPAEEFVRMVEKTSMSKAYKIPTILSLLEGDSIRSQVDLETIGQSIMDFYVNFPLHQKDLNDKSNRNWRKWGIKEFTSLARKNPVHFLENSKYFNYDEINRVFYLSKELEAYLSPSLADHIRDILEYRRVDYFRKRFK